MLIINVHKYGYFMTYVQFKYSLNKNVFKDFLKVDTEVACRSLYGSLLS